jgi:hypothetical protein
VNRRRKDLYADDESLWKRFPLPESKNDIELLAGAIAHKGGDSALDDWLPPAVALEWNFGGFP